MTTLINLFEYILLSAVIVMVFVGLTVGGSRQRVPEHSSDSKGILPRKRVAYGKYGPLADPDLAALPKEARHSVGIDIYTDP